MLTDKELKAIFNQKLQKISKKGKIKAGFVNTTFQQFKQWFDKDKFGQGCHYCGTTNFRSKELFDLQRNGSRLDATRGGKRGKRLELDRLDPSQPYDNLNNIVWCCYWCNNSKSNFFTEEEFKPIAIEIGNVLKKIH